MRLGMAAELSVGEDGKEDGEGGGADEGPGAKEDSSSGGFWGDLAVTDGAGRREVSYLARSVRSKLNLPGRDEGEVDGDEVIPVSKDEGQLKRPTRICTLPASSPVLQPRVDSSAPEPNGEYDEQRDDGL